jgi:hypothetical protein
VSMFVNKNGSQRLLRHDRLFGRCALSSTCPDVRMSQTARGRGCRRRQSSRDVRRSPACDRSSAPNLDAGELARAVRGHPYRPPELTRGVDVTSTALDRPSPPRPRYASCTLWRSVEPVAAAPTPPRSTQTPADRRSERQSTPSQPDSPPGPARPETDTPAWRPGQHRPPSPGVNRRRHRAHARRPALLDLVRF